jgi:hypothetical protein
VREAGRAGSAVIEGRPVHLGEPDPRGYRAAGKEALHYSGDGGFEPSVSAPSFLRAS